MPTITPLHENDIQPIGQMLGRAFFHDPIYRYVFPDDTTREALSAHELGLVARYGLKFGHAYTLGNASGCAIWLPPGETDFTEERMAQVGMLDNAAYMGKEASERFMHFVEATEEVHRRIVPEPHWYLVILGVDPKSHGQGLGSQLIRHGLQKADEGQFPCYLETANPKSLPFYQNFGFHVADEIDLGGSPVWFLLRDKQ